MLNFKIDSRLLNGKVMHLSQGILIIKHCMSSDFNLCKSQLLQEDTNQIQ